MEKIFTELLRYGIILVHDYLFLIKEYIMTEIEKMQRAKMYLDKLVNGLNPIDDSAVAPTDIVRNERIVNCFKYISNVLEKQIGNVHDPKKENKAFFYRLS